MILPTKISLRSLVCSQKPKIEMLDALDLNFHWSDGWIGSQLFRHHLRVLLGRGVSLLGVFLSLISSQITCFVPCHQSNHVCSFLMFLVNGNHPPSCSMTHTHTHFGGLFNQKYQLLFEQLNSIEVNQNLLNGANVRQSHRPFKCTHSSINYFIIVIISVNFLQQYKTTGQDITDSSSN